MPLNDSRCGRDSGEQRNGPPVSRRSYLRFAGTAVGAAGMFSGTASAATERHGMRFRTVVDMVAEAGCDPTGQEPCDEKIRQAADDYTLLKFPSGTYKITEKNAILDKTNLGFLGEGDVRFKVPEWFNEKALVVDRGTGVLFENIDVDLTAQGATPGLHLAVDDDLQIHDVEFVGQGVNPNNDPQDCGNEQIKGCHGNESVTGALYPIVRSPGGVGVVRNVVARNAGFMGTYTRIGVWIGASTEGTVRLENCRFEEFPGNGLYCSRTYGVVQVEGGEYRNNDVSQVRIGSRGSYVRNAVIVVNATNTRSSNPQDALNQRGIWLESRKIGGNGPEVRDCEIVIAETPNSSGGIVTASSVGDFSVTDTRIGVDVDGVQSINGYSPSDEPHSAMLRGVSITGSATSGQAIRLKNHPESVIDNCCIKQEGASRDGIRLDGSPGTVVRDSTINVTGRQIIEDGAVTTSNLSANGSCPAPSYNAGDDLSRTLTIEGAPESAYELAVSGSLEKSTAMRGTTIDPNDDLSEQSVTGQVGGGGRDSYAFAGEITRLVLDGGTNLYYDGERVDPAEYLPNVVTIESDATAAYEITTSDGVVKSTAMRGTTIDPNDDVSERTATGQVAEGGRDSYAFPGEIVSFNIDGNATVYRNGEEVDPDEFGPSVLTIEGAPEATYELAASESLDKSTAMSGATIDPNDHVSGQRATGQVGGGGRDSYAFAGEITRLVLNGGANLYYNTKRIDPSQFLPNTLTIESATSAKYVLTTSDGVIKSTATSGATIDPNDDVSGRTATGQVAEGGRDSYAFPGEVIDLDADGDVTVYYNGRQVSSEEVSSMD